MRAALLCLPLLAGCDDSTLVSLQLGRAAIVTGDFDTVESLIEDVAAEQAVNVEIHLYDGYISGPAIETEVPSSGAAIPNTVEDLLRDPYPGALATYDTAFFSDGMRGVNVRQYNGVIEDDHLVRDATVVDTVRESVEGGLSAYFSDWTYDLLEACWPDFATWVGTDSELDSAQRGLPGLVAARVVDEALAEAMAVPVGAELEVFFNYGSWAVPRAVSADATVLIEADVTYDDADTGQIATAQAVPLVFSIPAGAGKVVFTAFHNEAQLSDGARGVLRHALSELGR